MLPGIGRAHARSSLACDVLERLVIELLKRRMMMMPMMMMGASGSHDAKSHNVSSARTECAKQSICTYADRGQRRSQGERRHWDEKRTEQNRTPDCESLPEERRMKDNI
jgi:hypothetical protein